MSGSRKWTPVRELIVCVTVAALAPGATAAAAAGAEGAGGDPAPEVRLWGAVVDPVGGAIDGAVVAAVNLETGEQTAAVADERGRYRGSGLRNDFHMRGVNLPRPSALRGARLAR